MNRNIDIGILTGERKHRYGSWYLLPTVEMTIRQCSVKGAWSEVMFDFLFWNYRKRFVVELPVKEKDNA